VGGKSVRSIARPRRRSGAPSGVCDRSNRHRLGDCGQGGPCTLADPRAAEGYDVNVRSPILSTSNLKVNVGAMYELARDMWIGVAYHTPPGFGVQTELAGHVDVARAMRDLAAPDDPRVIHGQSVVVIQLPASVDAEFRARLPLELDLHVAGRWEDLSRLSAYDVRSYGTTLPRNNIPEWTERALQYMGLKAEAKKQANRVNDVTKSRDKWHAETEQLREQVEVLQAANAALQEQLAGLKKTGTAGDA
jgi:hypothetical protein